MALLTADEVHVKKFTPTKFREGYDQDEVDDFLDEVVETIAVLQDENNSLKAQLAQAEQQIADLSRQPAPQPVVDMVPEPVPAPIPEPEPQPEPVPEPVVQPVPEPENATSMLALAQRVHDEYVRNGQDEGDRIVSEARAQGEQIVREAEDAAKEMRSRLEEERSTLERKIDDLKQFEREYREQLHTHLEGLLKEVDEGGTAI